MPIEDSSSTPGKYGGVQLHRAVVGRAVLLVQLREALLVARLLAERAHDPHAGQRLLQVGGDVRDLLAHRPDTRPRRSTGTATLPDRQQRERREERDERQRHVEQQQDHDRPDQRQRAREERHDAVRDELVERLHVVGQARDQHAGLAAAEEADRLALEVGEDAQPQVLQRALADPARRGRSAGTSRPSRRAPTPTNAATIRFSASRSPARDAVVDRELGEVGRSEAGRGRQHQRHASPRSRAPRYGRSSSRDALSRRARSRPELPTGGRAAASCARRPCACRHGSVLVRLAAVEPAERGAEARHALVDDLRVQRRCAPAAPRGCPAR